MEWKRKDQMTPKERKKMKEVFLKSLKNDPDRIWKVVIINNTPAQYYISNDGKLASLRMCRLMSPHANPDGYIETVISHNNKRINISIHRLVAKAFISNPDNLPQVNHKDGDKSNNNDWNLEWMTQPDNITHAIETGLRDNYLPQYRCSKKDIHRVCKLLEKGIQPKNISSKTGVSIRVIKSIRRGKAWKHISKHYNIHKYLKEEASTTIQKVEILYSITPDPNNPGVYIFD